MEKEHLVPIIIPSYEPDERLIDIIKDLVEADLTPIVLVDDGSGDEYSKYFKEAQQIMGDKGVLLTHEVNKGKGRALKTAFSYILNGDLKSSIGAITADSDGQHTVECISKVKDALIAHPDDLILGVRKFDGPDVPWKSRAALAPYTAAIFIGTWLSNYMLLDELYASYIITLGMLWGVVILLIGTITCHELSFGKTIGFLLLTIAGMAVIVFVGVLFYTLLEQLITFFSTLYVEVVFRM